jgi:hypothetical protein
MPSGPGVDPLEHLQKILRTIEGVISDMSKHEVISSVQNWFSTQLGRTEYGGPTIGAKAMMKIFKTGVTCEGRVT